MSIVDRKKLQVYTRRLRKLKRVFIIVSRAHPASPKLWVETS